MVDVAKIGNAVVRICSGLKRLSNIPLIRPKIINAVAMIANMMPKPMELSPKIPWNTPDEPVIKANIPLWIRPATKAIVTNPRCESRRFAAFKPL